MVISSPYIPYLLTELLSIFRFFSIKNAVTSYLVMSVCHSVWFVNLHFYGCFHPWLEESPIFQINK